MRLGTVILSTTLSTALLSGCSFIGGQSSQNANPYAKQKTAQYGQYGQRASQRCQIASPRQPIPRGCRPEQVTIGTFAQGPGNAAYGAHGGFPQQPQFGQPQFTNGGYGNAVGQAPVHAAQTSGQRIRKPRLRGSLSLGVEKSISGSLLDFDVRDDLSPSGGYNPQDFNRGREAGSQASGRVTTTRYTANEQDAANIFAPNTFESASNPTVSFDDVWSTPASLKAGLEYIVNDNTTVFVNGGYAYSEGKDLTVSTVNATLYEQVVSQDWIPSVDANGDEIPGQFTPNGPPSVNETFIPNQEIARFAYDFSDLQRYDLEVGARRYFNPIVRTDGYKTITPFVGASVGVSHVNAVSFKTNQTQASYDTSFSAGTTEGNSFSVPTDGSTTELYDSQWLPQGQLNFGAEWQLTPGFAIAAETGLRVQGSRDYADFTNSAGEFVEGSKGDVNVSVPFTLRGSVNF